MAVAKRIERIAVHAPLALVACIQLSAELEGVVLDLLADAAVADEPLVALVAVPVLLKQKRAVQGLAARRLEAAQPVSGQLVAGLALHAVVIVKVTLAEGNGLDSLRCLSAAEPLRVLQHGVDLEGGIEALADSVRRAHVELVLLVALLAEARVLWVRHLAADQRAGSSLRYDELVDASGHVECEWEPALDALALAIVEQAPDDLQMAVLSGLVQRAVVLVALGAVEVRGIQGIYFIDITVLDCRVRVQAADVCLG